MKKKLVLILSMVMSIGMLASCNNSTGNDKGSAPTNEPVAQEDQASDEGSKEGESSNEGPLAKWENMHKEWNSITTFYDKDYLKAAAEEHAKEDNTTAEALLEEHEKNAHSDIGMIEFDGNKITLKDNSGNEIASSDYKFVKTIGEGEDHGEFDIFEAEGDVPEQFKALALMKPHGGTGDITHFHARYAESVDSPELTNEDWWPVYVDPSSTEEQVINEILAH